MSVTLSNMQPLDLDSALKYETFTSKMACKNVEENLRLIELIKERPIIYDSNMLGYKDTIKKETAWLSIAVAMHWPLEVCQTRWKSLRDSFRKRDKKSSPDVGQSTWRYTEMLKFLKHTNSRRKTCSDNISSLGYGVAQSSHGNADDSDHSDQPLSVHMHSSEENYAYDIPLDVKAEFAESNGLDDLNDAALPVNRRVTYAGPLAHETSHQTIESMGIEGPVQNSAPVQRLSPKSAHKVLQALATANVLKRKNKHRRTASFPYHRLPSTSTTISCHTQSLASCDQLDSKRPKIESNTNSVHQQLPNFVVLGSSNEQTPQLSPATAHPPHENGVDKHTCLNEIASNVDSNSGNNLNSDDEAAAAAAAAFFRRNYDEDDLFGLSVAASLKKCSDDQKLSAKIEIMQILYGAQRGD